MGICLSTSCCDAAAAAAAAAAASAGVRGRCLLGNIQHRINRVSATLTETCYVLPAQLFRAKFGGRGPELLIGHSLGGKVLLNYLAQGATGLPLPKQASALAVCTHLLLHNGPGVCYQVSVPLLSVRLRAACLLQTGQEQELECSLRLISIA